MMARTLRTMAGIAVTVALAAGCAGVTVDTSADDVLCTWREQGRPDVSILYQDASLTGIVVASGDPTGMTLVDCRPMVTP